MINGVNELHRQSKILSISMNALKAFTWYCDLRDGILRFGEGCVKIGIIPSEMDTLFKFGDKIHPIYREKYLNLMTEFCKQDSGEFAIEYEIDFRGSGEYEWWECRGAMEVVTEGDTTYKFIYGMDINIDKHKRDEMDILRTKEQLDIFNRNNELILNNTNSALAFLNNDYVVEWENVTTFFGEHPMTRNYQKGHCCYRVVKGLNEPCQDCVIQKSIASGKTEVKELVYNDKRIVELTAIPVFDEKNNERIGSVLKVMDVTEQKKIREELEAAKFKAETTMKFLKNIIDCLPCLLFIKDVDDDFKHILVNKYFCDVMGHSESEIIGKQDFDISGSREFADRCRADDEMIVAENKLYVYEEETTFMGERIVWQTTKTVAVMPDGHRALIAVALDITDKIIAYNELQKSKEKAEESNRLKSAFLANMSHEIRTPLNSIVGFSELMVKTDSDRDRKEYYGIIKNNNELLLQLIGDILDLSKIEAGIIEFNNDKFDMSELLGELFVSFKQRLSNARVRLTIENPYDVCLVELDKNRISQVITNFLTNAIKFTPSGEIKMGYEYRDGRLNIFVSDTGIGIAPEKLNLVFERFEKLNDFAQGTGLGMAICKVIINTLGGDVTVESELGKGSTFKASIPTKVIISERVAVKEKLSLVIPAQRVVNSIENPKNILVAEDNDSNYILMQHMLKGHQLERAFNGVEAVDKAKANRYDIILMDIKMPMLDGIGATKEIRQFDRKIPIYAVTANAFAADKDAAMAAGCTGYLTKPIIKEMLLKVINS